MQIESKIKNPYDTTGSQLLVGNTYHFNYMDTNLLVLVVDCVGKIYLVDLDNDELCWSNSGESERGALPKTYLDLECFKLVKSKIVLED